MNPKWHKRYIDIVNAAAEHMRGIVLLLVLLVSVLGIVTGFKYYNYTQEEPQYCATCHLMEDAIKEWSMGKHSNVVCQKCHQLSMFEQNQLLVAYVVKGTQTGFSQTHGRIKTWRGCKSCHEEILSQSTAKSPHRMAHPKHVIIQQIDCSVCHKNKLHSFQPSQMICISCHKGKGIHGLGGDTATYMQTCLLCHSFTEKKPAGVERDRCNNCHNKIPLKGTMADVRCHQCHRPHSNAKVTIDSCLRSCHSDVANKGSHRIHQERDVYCIVCHKPHRWAVDKNTRHSLCKQCHNLKEWEG